MLKMYYIYQHLYHGAEYISKKYIGRTLKEEDSASNEETEFNWSNLDSLYNQFHDNTGFKMMGKQGKRVIYFTDIEGWEPIFNKNYRPIKEKNGEPLNIKIITEYKEEPLVSISEILHWPNVEKTIQYLKERGLTIQIN